MQLRSPEPPGYLVIDTVDCQMQCMLSSEEYDSGHMCWNMNNSMNWVVYMYNNTNYKCATLLVMFAVCDLYPKAKSIIFTPDTYVRKSGTYTHCAIYFIYVHTHTKCTDTHSNAKCICMHIRTSGIFVQSYRRTSSLLCFEGRLQDRGCGNLLSRVPLAGA